jgi:hypothetical protein
MPATTDELTYARSYIGTTETDDVFNERVDRLEPIYSERAELIDASIEESLRAQLASLVLDSPGQASLGSISFSNATNIQTLATELQTFRRMGGSASSATRGIHVGHLVRQRKR